MDLPVLLGLAFVVCLLGVLSGHYLARSRDLTAVLDKGRFKEHKKILGKLCNLLIKSNANQEFNLEIKACIDVTNKLNYLDSDRRFAVYKQISDKLCELLIKDSINRASAKKIKSCIDMVNRLSFLEPERKCLDCENHSSKQTPIKGLKYITAEKVQESLALDSHWNLFHERKFAETLFSQRFNFFMIAFSIIISALVVLYNKADCNPNIMRGMGGFGLVFVLLFWYILYRSYKKVVIYLRMIHAAYKHDNSIFKLTKHEMTTYDNILKIKTIWVMSIFIPIVCVLVMLTALTVICLYYEPKVPLQAICTILMQASVS